MHGMQPSSRVALVHVMGGAAVGRARALPVCWPHEGANAAVCGVAVRGAGVDDGVRHGGALPGRQWPRSGRGKAEWRRWPRSEAAMPRQGQRWLRGCGVL